MRIYRDRQEPYVITPELENLRQFYIQQNPTIFSIDNPKRDFDLISINGIYGKEAAYQANVKCLFPENKEQSFVGNGGQWWSGEDTPSGDGSLPPAKDPILEALARIEAKIDKLFIKTDDGKPPVEVLLYAVRFAQFMTDPSGQKYATVQLTETTAKHVPIVAGSVLDCIVSFQPIPTGDTLVLVKGANVPNKFRLTVGNPSENYIQRFDIVI